MTCQEKTQQDQTANPITESAHLCSPNYSVEAVILYPSLGMPMVLGKDQEKCSLIIATGENALGRFGITKERDQKSPKACQKAGEDASLCVKRHLRLMPIDASKHECAGDVERGTQPEGLCKNGKKWYSVTTEKAISVWYLGKIEDGMLIASKGGEPFAVLASCLFGSKNPREPRPYKGMAQLWEVEIDLEKANLMGKITSDEFLNWAWLVKTKDMDYGNIFLREKHLEPQDRMIDGYLRHLAESDRHYEHCHLYEVDLSENEGRYPPLREPQDEAKKYVKRLQSWHPVIRATSLPLKLAHLTDMHVNVRQDVLARSKTRVIEDTPQSTAGQTEEIGGKVAHAFWSFKELIEQMAGGKGEGRWKKREGVDRALLLTGDYIDYNRNINPRALEPGVLECKARESEKQRGKVQETEAKNSETKPPVTIGDQWKAFNILANQDTSGMYQRGLDNTLVYSLVRYAYTEHKMPVFMVSGNHEPYQFPYGISPRLNLRLIVLGLLELINFPAEWYKKRFIKGGSRWANRKTDERISADHNLTIYEATLAYGPTYAQVMTSENFDARQFDWFHMLFTPFSDAVLALESEAKDKNGGNLKQILALLGWGSKENLLNLGDLLPLGDVDAQGPGILPRAVESFSKDQQLLMNRAKELKENCKRQPLPHFVVASHFPMVSYHLLTAFNEEIAFTPQDSATGLPFTKEVKKDAAFNKVNEGTCEQNQRWFYQNMVFDKSNNVDWYISGHSHRSGFYRVKKESLAEVQFKVLVRACDPGLKVKEKPDLVGEEKNEKESETRFLVSSSAGPLGKQNLKGEFGGWMTRPPSGSWIDMSVQGQEKVEQVKVIREKMNEKPRLCVILDYMAVMKNPKIHKIEPPLKFMKESWQPFNKGVEFTLSEEMVERNCLNLKNMKFWLFQPAKKGSADLGNWISIGGNITKGGRMGYSLMLSAKVLEEESKDTCLKPPPPETEPLNDEIVPSKHVLQAFCEIPLKKLDDTDDSSSNLEGLDGSGDLKDIDPNCDLNRDDPWIFPLEIGIVGKNNKKYYFRRPSGEKGEVPDWWFRAEYFGDTKGYIRAREAIDPNNEGSSNRPNGPFVISAP